MEDDFDTLKVRVAELSSKLETEQQKIRVLGGLVQLLMLARDQQSEINRPRLPVPKGTRDRRTRHANSSQNRRERKGHGSHSPDRSSSDDEVRLVEFNKERESEDEEVESEFDDIPRRRSRPSGMGPRKSGLRELDPQNPIFKSALSYRRYRLQNTDPDRSYRVKKLMHKRQKRLRPVKDKYTFDGSNSIAILRFVSVFKSQLDQDHIGEGAALLILPEFLAGDARDAWEASFEISGEMGGGFTTWPEAVQFLLRTYAKDRHVKQVSAEMDQMKQIRPRTRWPSRCA